jgi:predicted RNA binding protein YcfA (HicA-like mRNA interferase family)
MSEPSVFPRLIGMWVLGLAVLMIAVSFGVIIAALLGTMRPSEPRPETPEVRARRERLQTRLDRRMQATALARATGSSWSFTLGAMMATFVKRRSLPDQSAQRGESAQDRPNRAITAADAEDGAAERRREAALTDDGTLFPVKVRDLIALIEADGWMQVRTRGSHRQFRHPRKSGTVTVAGRPGVDVPSGTLNSVLKQAGLKR